MSFNDFFISAANVLVCRWPRVQRDQYWPRWPTETCSCIRPCLKAKRASAAPPRVTHSLLPGSYAHAYKCTHAQHMQKWSFVSVQTEHSSHSFIVPSYSHTNHNPFAQKSWSIWIWLSAHRSLLHKCCHTLLPKTRTFQELKSFKGDLCKNLYWFNPCKLRLQTFPPRGVFT